MAKTENILHRMEQLKEATGVSRTLFAACPNSISVIKASFRAAKRNNAPIYFATTLNQVDCDGGYTGMTQAEFTRILAREAEAVNYTGPYVVAIDHGGPWLKDIQSIERWNTERAMEGVKKSYEAAILAGYDLIHVDPTVDIFLPKGEIINIHTVAQRTVELIKHAEDFRKANGMAPISYEVGTEEVHGGLADETTFDTFLSDLKKGLTEAGLPDIWPIFIVGKVGTDLHTATFDPEVAKSLTAKVRPYGSYIKGHYTDGVTNPEAYPLSGMGAANVGPEFTMSEYDALAELEQVEQRLFAEGKIAQCSHITHVLWQMVYASGRWKKWLHGEEVGHDLKEVSPERQLWLVKTGCRYIWQKPEALVARQLLYDNLQHFGIQAEDIVLMRIEHDMDKYYNAFNIVNLNDAL
ncbi:MAG: class II D-tagatose-bisphosphate aldolase, non-catalytic subunit [Paludibacter sp.]|nr:class II D-tagatose-bisphosphate aldolase, non-catalytic subunit [Bacteroidales bacterium]MCM1068497.1 class II D-tagatose-bisphosphate aldolase, non-catalytic subunit [Prevotella sp.]MCM1353451.1 class II D-tagatose-bisphosphate aldolase, non-catalytic subunit [Bacteroides sp.]MCM1442612.1 class II D-tagatose-bisphosphate aldolase, non-catalytic subunit [Muribaculum sp.]MCM1481457.1 class II D-tagatose-bisphosphate aldolase, non-catalytic subunit [Paludibacter sp.]